MSKLARSVARTASRRRRVSAVVGVAALILVVEGVFALTGTSALRPFTAFHGAAVPRAVAPISQTNKTTGQITVGHSYKNDVSGPLTSLPRQPLNTPRPEREVIPNLHPVSIHQNSPDAVVQRTVNRSNMPAPILSFDGIPFPGVTCNCAPPDTNGEVGATQYVQIVNQGFQVFNKTTGGSLLGPVGIGTLWTGFGGACELHGFGDPVAVYDQLANRWLISQFASATGGLPITDECIAVSQTGDATGSYFRYGYHLGSDFFDYPKIGMWPDAYYMTMNVFNSSGTAFLGAEPFAFNRAAMLAGSPGTFITSRDSSFFNPSADAMLPGDLDGANLPPSGAPDPFMQSGENTTAWKIWRFHVDFGTPANSTFTLCGQPDAGGLHGALFLELRAAGGHVVAAVRSWRPLDVPLRLQAVPRRPRGARREPERLRRRVRHHLQRRPRRHPLVGDQRCDVGNAGLGAAEHLRAGRRRLALDGQCRHGSERRSGDRLQRVEPVDRAGDPLRGPARERPAEQPLTGRDNALRRTG